MVSQPSAPNPYATAAAQNQQNQQASQYSSVAGNANEVNPYGTVSYNAIEQVPVYGANGQVTSYAPRYQRTTTLSPDQQKLMGLETQSKYNMGTAGVEQSAALREHLKNNTIDPSKWQAWGAAPGKQDLRQDAGPTDRAGIEKSMMESYNRSVKGQEQEQEANLAARGLSPGGQGYGQYQMQRDDNRAEAARKAYLTSGDESRRAQAAYNDVGTQRFNMDQAISQYYNNLRGAQSQEAYGLRNQPINEITALMNGGQATIPQFQAFQGSPIAASNIAQYINDNYKAESQSAANTNAGIFGMMGGLMKMMPMM